MDFMIRFVCGGLLVATVPWVAARFGDTVAGLVLLFPVLTIAGLTVLGLDRGMVAVVEASGTAVLTVPVLALFLIAVNLAARYASLAWTLIAGAAVWAVGAAILIYLTREGG